MAIKRAIVLLSGGMDSLVTTAVAEKECEELYFLHIAYGQHTQERERQCFEALVQHYKPAGFRILDWRWLAALGGSRLIDDSFKMPESKMNLPFPDTYVPFRNASFLCAAVAWAEVLGANRIYLGAVEDDSSGYPDCRQVFFDAMQKTIETGSANTPPIVIHTPVLHLSKAQIVSLGMSLGAPFGLSWSCYFASEEACGECDSCILRLRAFKEAGATDPIKYRRN